MVSEIKMPKLGDTMEEGILSKWRKNVGEKIEKGEILFEVMTDKANFEVESPASGFIRKIFAKEEETVPVIQVIGYIASSMEEAVPDSAPSSKTQAVAKKTETIKPKSVSMPKQKENVNDTDRIKASPLARKIASERGINLSMIKGSGPGGRIQKEDVLNARQQAGASPVIDIPVPEGAVVIPVTGVRKIIAERMTMAKNTVPHYYLNVEIDFSKAVELRDAMKKEKKFFSHNDLLIKAASEALKALPVVNGYFGGDKIILNSKVNIGFAVARSADYKTSSGDNIELSELVVPVVKDVCNKDLVQVALETKDLIKKARENKLSVDELKDGTFTISNLGTGGIDVFSAIINPPQATILAVGEIKKQPVVVDEKIEIRSVVKMSLSCDHRIVDGALGAKFLKKLKDILEAPETISK